MQAWRPSPPCALAAAGCDPPSPPRREGPWLHRGLEAQRARVATADLPALQPHTHTPLGLITTHAGLSALPASSLVVCPPVPAAFHAAPAAPVPAMGGTRGDHGTKQAQFLFLVLLC